MKGKKDGFYKGLFLVASIYDLLIGLIFFLFYKPIYGMFNITLPTFPMYLQMAAAFVIAMGVGYFLIFLNMYRNIDLVKLGVVYKATYAGLTSYFYFANLANVTFFWLAIIDIIFLILFINFLVYAAKDKKYLKWK